VTLKCGWYRARHKSDPGPYTVRIRVPMHGGPGRSVWSPPGHGPAGQLARLCAAGWRFTAFREAPRGAH